MSAFLGPLVYARLNAEVPALGGRIYPVEMAQHGALPAAYYTVIGAITITGSAPVATLRLQIDVLGASHAEAVETATAIAQALEGWTAAGGLTAVCSCYQVNRTDYPLEADAYRVSLDFEAVTRPTGG